MTSKARLFATTMFALGAGSAPACALGQVVTDRAEDGANTETIVVTGSFIRGTAEDGVLPVDTFGAAELERRGIESPLEFIKTLPSVGPVLGQSNQYAAGTEQGVGSINLRSLGRERTLVLFNGRRFIPSPGTGAADTNLVPFFALERVEILKDGAASTYGSDAIAGVANFITPGSFDGLRFDGDYSFIDGSDGNSQVSVLAGRELGGVDVLVGAGWQRQSELPNTARRFTQPQYADNPTGFSFLSNPGTYLPVAVIPGVGPTVVGLGVDGQAVDACSELGGVNGVFPTATSVFPVCRYSYTQFTNLTEEQDRYQVYGQLDFDVTDTTKIHAEALWARTEQTTAYSPSYPPVQGPRGPGSANAFSVPASNPGFDDFLDQTFAGGLPVPPALANILFFRPFALGGNPLDERGAGTGEAENEAWRVNLGIEQEVTDSLSAQLYGTYIKSERTNFSRDFVGDRLQRALNGFGGPDCSGTTPGENGCVYFNPFINSVPSNPITGAANPAYVPGNENDPALVEWLYQPSGTNQTEDQYILDLIFSGESALAGLDVGYAFGAQYRRSEYASEPLNVFSDPAAFPCAIEGDRSCVEDPNDSNLPTGAFIFLGQYADVDVEQDVYALFAEGQIEPFDGFTVTGAVRYEDYGDPVGSTFNPKLSARWQVTDWIGLRGSIGETFRAPLAGDLQGDGLTLVSGIDAAGGAFKAQQIAGNPDLEPETATTFNVGSFVEFGGLRASVDYWSYDFEGRFTLLPIQAIASAVAPGPVTDGTQAVDCGSPFVQFVVFAGGACTEGTTANDISRINIQTVNGPAVKTTGLDFNLNYDATIGAVDVSAGANATHTLTYEFGDFEYEGLLFTPGYDAAGFANYNRAPDTVSPWRASGYASATHGITTWTYNTFFVDGVEDNRCPDDGPCTQTPEFGPTDFGRTVGSFWQHDVLVTLDLSTDQRDVRLQAGVENIADTDPPEARLELSYDPYIANPYGRIYKLGLTVGF